MDDRAARTGFHFADDEGFLTRIAIPKLGEHRAAYIGLFAGAIGFAGYAFATQGWQMYPWMLVWALMGLAMPSINAMTLGAGQFCTNPGLLLALAAILLVRIEHAPVVQPAE